MDLKTVIIIGVILVLLGAFSLAFASFSGSFSGSFGIPGKQYATFKGDPVTFKGARVVW